MILLLQWNRTLSQLQKVSTSIHCAWVHLGKNALQRSTLYTQQNYTEIYNYSMIIIP